MERIAAIKHKIDVWGEGSLPPGFKLRVIDSIKPALAMSIVIGLAFYLDLKQPYWAAFAVLMMSFSTTGQAFRRALVGIPGTLIGGLVALTLFSIFPQQPIFLFPMLIIYCGIAMYFLQACKVNGYFFFTMAFVCLVVITTAIPHSSDVFEYALARLEETCLGMTVYAAVTLLLWRRNALPVLHKRVDVLTSLHAELFKAQMRRVETMDKKRVFALQRKILRSLDTVEELVGFAVTDSYAVWENRKSWHTLILHSRVLLRAQLRWGWIVPELRKEYMQKSLPDLSKKIRQLEARLLAMKQGLHAEQLQNIPHAIQLIRNEEEYNKLSHFLKAQVVVVQSAFNEMGKLVHTIMQFHCFFHDESLKRPKPYLKEAAWEFPLDFDYVVYAFQSVVTFSIAAVLWFYFYPPGLDNAQFIQLGGAFALITVFVSSREPFLYGLSYVLAGFIVVVLYVLTIQHFTTYYGLGSVIFCVTFVTYFILTKSSQAPLKLSLMLAWLAFPRFSNVQVYDFTNVLNSAVAMMLAGLLAGAGMYLTAYPLPERRFLRERRRFFSCAIFILELLPRAAAGRLSLVERLRLKASLQNLIRVPQKLLRVAEKLDTTRLGVSRNQMGSVIFSFELLGEALLSLYKTHMQGDNVWIVKELSEVLDDWRHTRLTVLRAMERNIASPDFDEEAVQKRLRRRMQRVEEVIGRACKDCEEKGIVISPKENEILYRLIERNRGLSNAILEYLNVSQAIDWEEWAQHRF